jgi:hypothetical protein
MSLKNKLANDGSPLTKYDGATPPTMTGASEQSKLHNQYSINGNPNVAMKPSPSTLDLNGLTPPKYTDNLPG